MTEVLERTHTYMLTPRCVCVSLVMVWGLTSPVCCVTKISFYRSTLSRRNTHTQMSNTFTHTQTHTHITPQTLHALNPPVLLPLLSFCLDTLLHVSLSPFFRSLCLSLSLDFKREKHEEKKHTNVFCLFKLHTHVALVWTHLKTHINPMREWY